MTPIVVIAIIVFAAMAAAFFLYAALRRRKGIQRIEELPAYTTPVCVPALLNLLDDREEQFLRNRLRPAEFRAIQRKRICVVLQYVKRIDANAAILQGLAQRTEASSDPQLGAATQQLATLAFQTRLNALLVRVELLGRLLLVRPPGHVHGTIQKYTSLRDRVQLLARLQSPERASSISASL